MTIIGIGSDLVHLPRITRFIERRGASALANRILSPKEKEDWLRLTTQNASRFLAVRWACKEAAYKALYPMYRPRGKELTYQSFHNGVKPTLSFCPASNTSNACKLHCSITHDGEYVIAMVVAESTDT